MVASGPTVGVITELGPRDWACEATRKTHQWHDKENIATVKKNGLNRHKQRLKSQVVTLDTAFWPFGCAFDLHKDGVLRN